MIKNTRSFISPLLPALLSASKREMELEEKLQRLNQQIAPLVKLKGMYQMELHKIKYEVPGDFIQSVQVHHWNALQTLAIGDFVWRQSSKWAHLFQWWKVEDVFCTEQVVENGTVVIPSMRKMVLSRGSRCAQLVMSDKQKKVWKVFLPVSVFPDCAPLETSKVYGRFLKETQCFPQEPTFEIPGHIFNTVGIQTRQEESPNRESWNSESSNHSG
jgi:hypothetical protein